MQGLRRRTYVLARGVASCDTSCRTALTLEKSLYAKSDPLLIRSCYAFYSVRKFRFCVRSLVRQLIASLWLEYDPEMMRLIRDERMTPEERAEEVDVLAEHRRPTNNERSDLNKGVNNTFIQRGSTNADYLTARIARDRPDILDKLQAAQIEQRISTQVEIGVIPAKHLVPLIKAGEYTSVRSAALDAGIVKPRISIPTEVNGAARATASS